MYWSFAEPVPESPRSFIVAARAYAADIAATDPSEALEAQLPISYIRIRHENWTQGPDNPPNLSQSTPCKPCADAASHGVWVEAEIGPPPGAPDSCPATQLHLQSSPVCPE